nr:hypothetical protein [Dongia deserti]
MAVVPCSTARFHVERAAVTLHQLPGERQAKAGAIAAEPILDLVERLEHLFELVWRVAAAGMRVRTSMLPHPSLRRRG